MPIFPFMQENIVLAKECKHAFYHIMITQLFKYFVRKTRCKFQTQVLMVFCNEQFKVCQPLLISL